MGAAASSSTVKQYYCTNPIYGTCLDKKEVVGEGLNPSDYRAFNTLEGCKNRCPLPNPIFNLIGENLGLSGEERLVPFQPNSEDYKVNQEVENSVKQLRSVLNGSLDSPQESYKVKTEALNNLRRIWTRGKGFWNIWETVKVLWEVEGVSSYGDIALLLLKIVYKKGYPFPLWLHAMIQFLAEPHILKYGNFYISKVIPSWRRNFENQFATIPYDASFIREFSSDVDELLHSVYVPGTVFYNALEATLDGLQTGDNEEILQFAAEDLALLTTDLPFNVLRLIMHVTLHDLTFPFNFYKFVQGLIKKPWTKEQEEIVWNWFNEIWSKESADQDMKTYFPEKKFTQLLRNPASSQFSRSDIAFQFRQSTMVALRQSDEWMLLDQRVSKARSSVAPAAADAAAAYAEPKSGGSFRAISFLF